jgi:precorrin-6B methylase 2
MTIDLPASKDGALRPDTILKWGEGLTVRLSGGGECFARAGSVWTQLPPDGLAVLELFRSSRSFESAIQELRSRVTGAQDWMECVGSIQRFYEAGVLAGETAAQPTLASIAAGFDGAGIHIAMLEDRTRTQAYLRAIRSVVRPGDVVVDIGTGTGVLAIAAAQAGAARVYAVEAGAVGSVACQMFAANGLADRIHLVAGWSSRVELPERADVLVTETLGDDPFEEGIQELVLDARKRFLKPDARLIPFQIRLYGTAVALPASERERLFFHSEGVSRWRDWYGIEFENLLSAVPIAPQRMVVEPSRALKWKTLTEPVLLTSIDLSSRSALSDRVESFAEAQTDGSCDAIVCHFETELGAGERISTRPGFAPADCHWETPVWVLPQPLGLRAGSKLRLTYRRRDRSGAAMHISCQES